MSDQIFAQLAVFPAAPLLVVLILTIIPTMLVRNWRITLPALMVQYVLLGLLLARVLPNVAVAVKPVVGITTGLILSIAAQRADIDRSRRGHTGSTAQSRISRADWSRLPSQLLMRLVVMLLTVTAAFGATNRFPLPGNARELAFGAYLLVFCGIIVAATASEGLNIGLFTNTLFYLDRLNSLAIRSVRHQSIPDIDDRKYPRRKGNLFAFQPAWIS